MSGPATPHLTIPKDCGAHPPERVPAQEAMHDSRSDRMVPIRQEQMDMAFGVAECIAWQRMPDGRIQRPSTNPFTRHEPGEEHRPVERVR